jgi:ribosomal protein S12 methylthiotransferase accessory factor
LALAPAPRLQARATDQLDRVPALVTEIELLDIDLESPAGTQLVNELASSHGTSLARACSLPTHLFLLRSPWMPGLRFVGGKADAQTPSNEPQSLNLAGTGERLEDALASCVGEAAERLSQVERADDVRWTSPLTKQTASVSSSVLRLFEEALHRKQLPRAVSLDWVHGVDLHDGSPTAVPADWCLRRSAPGPLFEPTVALSTGVAAGSSFDDAAARAILELIERDAAALWWCGGVHGRPIACEGAAVAEAVRLLACLRAGSRQRISWLLDITSDLEVPVVATLSCNRNGSGFAFGLGAAATLAGATRKALLELGQTELGLQLAARKQRTDETLLNETDRRHLARAGQVHADTCALLHPRGVPRAENGDIRHSFETLKAVLAKHKMHAVVIDHTRPDIAIRVVQVICPELQPMPSSRQSARLAKAIAASGSAWSLQTPLL